MLIYDVVYRVFFHVLSFSHCLVTDHLMLFPADLAAIPDFQSGAMENWGLTTYRETGLLFDPDKSSASDKLGITKVIAHELAHQVPGLPLVLSISVS